MPPHLAQVLNTLAHEIRTPLAVSQGYLKLFLDGRFADENDTRKAMEHTRQALGALATYCVDMGKISAISERGAGAGIAERVAAGDFVDRLTAHPDLGGIAWHGESTGAIDARPVADLIDAVAIVVKAAFDEAKGQPHDVTVASGASMTLLAGRMDWMDALQRGPQASEAKAVNFGKGGKGLKLIWAAFVLDAHGVQTWTLQDHKASVGIRIPLVTA